jgi:hypothetical protein
MRKAGRRFMRVPTIVLAVAAVGLGSAASADPYKDLAAQGYRWVIVDGPYACPSKDDLQEIARHRTDLLEVKMVSELRAYYLIRGVIVQVVQEDAASGMSEVHLPGGFRTFWTLTRFLSKSPIKDTFGVVETPTTSSLIPQRQTGVASPTPTPIPTPPPVGIQPSISLPSGYTLKWNQDFTTAAYSPFNQPSIVSLSGPPSSIWQAFNPISNGNCYTKFNGTEGDPFSTSRGYLNIHGNGSPPAGVNPYGGQIASATDRDTTGFTAARNAYWEAKILLPGGGQRQWPAFWLFGRKPDPTTGLRPEVDIMEYGYQIPGTTNGNFQIHLHTWGTGASAGDGSFGPPLSITPGGWHVFGCLVQPGTVSIYLDGSLVRAFPVDSTFTAPMGARLDMAFGPGFPTSGCDSGDLGCQYIRCWTP